jgi:hypothetical protein
MVFSIYTEVQVTALREQGLKLEALSADWETGTISNLHEYYGLFWLWLLGAYEVVRTMAQHKHCFSVAVQDEIQVTKQELAAARMPFAKQEAQYSGEPIYNELSVVGFGKGMLFPIGEDRIDSGLIVEKTISFFERITLEDIVQKLPTRLVDTRAE